MAIVYLDVDDEITSAAARIRRSEAVDVVLVLPSGSRIATSRINFRLLSRESTERSRRLSIVTPDAAARALAATAGIPVYATVLEYENEHLAGAGDQGSGEGASGGAASRTFGAGAAAGGSGAGTAAGAPGVAGAGAAAAGVAGGAAIQPGPGSRIVGRGGGGARTAGSAAAAGAGAAAGVGAAAGADAAADSRRAGTTRSGAHARPLEPPPGPPAETRTLPTFRPPVADPRLSPREGARPRVPIGASTGLGAAQAPAIHRRRRWPLVVAAILVVAVLGGVAGAAGYVLLPSGTVVLELVAVPVGPVSFTAVADPDAVAVDPARDVVPATRVTVPLQATGTFKATGKRVEEKAATGTVRWDNCDNSRAYTIPKATVVRTTTGIGFATAESILVPVAITTGVPPNLTVTCQSRTVAVTAVKAGLAGNVEAGAIRVVPGDYNPTLVRVRNPSPTTGGTHDEFPQVTQKDVDAAVAALTKQLDGQLTSVAASPPGTPSGAQAYPQTAARGDATPSEPVAGIVGREVETFDLALSAQGTVVAVDQSPIAPLGTDRVTAKVPQGMDLRTGSLRVDVGEGVVRGQTIAFTVSASAEAVPRVTEDQVRALVKGKTAAAAEQALAAFGRATVTTWPDWAQTVTSLDARLEVTVNGVPPAEPTPSPAAPPATSPPPSGSRAPGSSSSPGPSPAPSETAAP